MKAVIFALILFLAVGVSAQTVQLEKVSITDKKQSSQSNKTEEAQKDEKITGSEKQITSIETQLRKTPLLTLQTQKTFLTNQPEVESKVSEKPPLTQSSDNEYHQGEIYVGFSGAFAIDDELGFEPGFNASGVYYFHRYVGAKVDFSATFQPISSGDHSLYNITGGVQFKDSAKSKKIKPFAHMLVGFARHKDTRNNFPQFNFESDGLSTVFGGGLDIKVTDNIDIRAFQLDINPIFSEDITGFKRTYLNFRYGAGVVFNF